MYKVYRYKRDGSIELVEETMLKKEAKQQAIYEECSFVNSSNQYENDFDIVRVIIRHKDKIIHDKKDE